MNDSDQREFKEQLNRIERCLVGDAAMGQVGLVAHVNNHESRIKLIERAGIYAAGAIGGLIVIYNIGLAILRAFK